MKVNAKRIISCANSPEGLNLVIRNGRISKQFHNHFVPYALINGVEFDEFKNFTVQVCAAFKHPPDVCKEVLYL